MDSDLHLPHHHQQQQQQQQPAMNSGLTRNRSAPSSYFMNLINSGNYGGEDCDGFLNPRAPSPATERIFSRFMSGGVAGNSNPQNLSEIGGNDLQFVGEMKHELEEVVIHSQQQRQQQQQQMIYQNESQPTHDSVGVSSMAIDRLPQMNNSNLIRQSSSPAGLFSHINIDNGYPAMRAMGDFETGKGPRKDLSFSSTKRLKREMGFSSVSPSFSGLLSHIPESKTMGNSSPSKDGSFGEAHREDGGYGPCFPSGSWDDSAILSETYLKELEDGDRSTFQNVHSQENQNDEGRNRASTTLTHHLSLPTSSAELSAMEKLLHFQDSVPLKIRAKRGCATHPRSIAERVRRTRISERMRKLQDLVPNMDKQTNTADMLDLAVDYIKDLQKQVETFSDQRAKCTCPNKQKS